MSQSKSSAGDLRQYLIDNPILDRGTPGCYKSVADKFGVTTESVRHIYKRLRKAGLVPNDQIDSQSPTSTGQSTYSEDTAAGKASVTQVTEKRIKTLAELVQVCEIDEKVWEIIQWECNKWEVGRKNKKVDWKSKNGKATGSIQDDGDFTIAPLYQVKAKLQRRRLSTDLTLQKEAILEELRGFSPHVKMSVPEKQKYDKSTYLLEICLFDVHFGKLAWREETGEDYDLKIAEARFKKAIDDLLDKVPDLNCVKKIMLPLGNDMVNVDGVENKTTAGTPQDSDARYGKIIKVVRRILVETINTLSLIAPVDVIMVPGNHDNVTTFMIGEILDAFFYKNERVNIDNDLIGRKYYQFGEVGIQLTHGNEENHRELGLLFASERKRIWADTTYRFCQIGHYHKNKKIEYTSVDQYPGFIVQTIPSLSGKDKYHHKKGYDSLKQAKSFLYHPETGLHSEYTTSVAH